MEQKVVQSYTSFCYDLHTGVHSNPSYHEELERPEGLQGKLALTSYRWLTTLRTAGMSCCYRLLTGSNRCLSIYIYIYTYTYVMS